MCPRSVYNARALWQALAAAAPGSTVKVAGDCAGAGAQNGTLQAALITQTLTLAGGYTTTNWTTYDLAANPTVLDALGQGRGVYAAVAATVQGLTVTNGSAPDGWGGGLYAAAALTLSRMTVSNNTAAQSNAGAGAGGGGGAYIVGAAVVQDSVFSGNRFTATVTCGLCYGGGALFVGAAQVTNTVFSGNVATSTVASLPGGGAAFQNSAWVAGSRFQENRARGNGGGAYFTLAGQQFQLTGTVFLSNTAGSFGGGFYAIMLGNYGYVTNTAFLGNVAGSHGGGAEMIGGTGRFVNVLFARNTASSGAAVYGSSNQGLELQHVTIVSPTLVAASAIQGNAIAITNSIVASHTIGLDGGTVVENYNLFDTVATPHTGTVTSGGNSLTATVGFVNAAAGDYHLGPASAAIDRGANLGVTFDFEGDPRPIGVAPDIGYDEAPAVCFTEWTGDGLTDFSSPNAQAVRDAVSAAAAGGTVRVAGDCAGVTTQSGTTQTVLVTKTLTLAGGYASDNWTVAYPLTQPTTLDAAGGGRALYASASVTVTNLTAQNGNLASGDGGGAYFGAAAVVNGVTFDNNTASNGNGGGAQFAANAVVSGSTFSRNTSGGALGGGGGRFSSTANVFGTTFTGNTASAAGGGAAFPGLGAAVSLSNTVFSDNTTADRGGALFAGGALYVTNTTFINNTANNGGGVYLNGLFARQVVNTLFARNRASLSGAALYVNGASTFNLINTTIVSPTAPTGASQAVYIAGGTTINITNTLIANHTIGLERVGSTLSENYNLFDGVATPYSGTVVSGGNSFTGTAAFADVTLYKLTSASAARDVGANVGVTTDFEGNPRPFGAGFDIGWDEWLGYTITPTAGANGSITPSIAQTVTAGSSITFTIAADANYHIADVGVDGASVGAVSSYTFNNVTANHTLTATFAINIIYTITPTAGANGSITPSIPQTVTAGSSITFTIAANANYHIADVGVDGASVGAVSSYTFNNVTAHHTITASFAIDTFVITPTAGANGSITPSAAQTVNYGDDITFTIAANANYHITDVGVDGVSVGAVSSYTFNNVTAHHTITAAFAIDTFVITPTAGANGSITPSTPQTVNYGDDITFTIAANANYHITDVGVDGVSVGAVSGYTFNNVIANHTLTATFAINTYTLTVTIAGAGSGVVTPNVGVYTYTYGTVVTPTATANTGSTFTGWSGACSGTGACVVTITNAQSVTATFSLITYVITPTAGVGGAITPGAPQTANSGGSITFTIAANIGYSLVDVGVDGLSQGAVTSYTFTNVTANHTITAAFALNTYTLTVATTGAGSGVVTPTVGVYTYTHGTVITPTATANPGSTFMGWSGACSGTGACVITLTNNQSVTATFGIVEYKLYLPLIMR